MLTGYFFPHWLLIFSPLRLSPTHGDEEPINADGDMYAPHICHVSLPWQHQLLRERRALLVLWDFVIRGQLATCAQKKTKKLFPLRPD